MSQVHNKKHFLYEGVRACVYYSTQMQVILNNDQD